MQLSPLDQLFRRPFELCCIYRKHQTRDCESEEEKRLFLCCLAIPEPPRLSWRPVGLSQASAMET